MKAKLILLLVLFAFAAHAKIWRVNNNAGVSADFTTAQAAHDGAAAGDTIMFEPSATSYGNLTATKKVILIGPGYRVAENYPTYFTGNNASIDNVTFNTGSQNSTLMGLTLSLSSVISINTSNINIIRNAGSVAQPSSINIGNVSNIIVSQNYGIFINSINTCTNVLISNNYLIATSGPQNYASGAQILFSNNIISTATSSFNGQTLNNNILIGGTLQLNVGTTYSNNIDAKGSSATFGTANGNIGNVTQAQVFVGATGNSFDGQWKLKTGSLALGAGVGGVDCGMYGGSTPYVLSGLPPIPAVTKLITTGTGSNTTPLQVTISVESKN